MSSRSPQEEQELREAVFRTMFENHFQRVVRYVEGQVSNHATAEDVAADVFRVAWQKLDPELPFGLPWLIRTAMHKTRDAQRGQYRGAAAMLALAQLAETSSEELHPLERVALYNAMGKLSRRDLEIVRLTYWDGLTAGEVATVVGLREGAVWTRLHRARGQLRAALGEHSAIGGDR